MGYSAGIGSPESGITWRGASLHAIALVAVFVRLTMPVSSQTQPAALANQYVIGPQDALIITVYGQPDLNGSFRVDADGTFTFPLIGRVKAGDLTVQQLETEMKRQLMAYFRAPQVSVAVDQYRSRRVFIVGEVRNPGPHALSGNMSLIEAIALAGSALPTASGDALIVRAGATGSDATGPTMPNGDKTKVETVDLNALQRGNLQQNVTLRDGDTVFVPRAETVFVFGQVKNPGAYPIQRGTTVLQALSVAGGVSDRGAANRVRIERMENGKKIDIRVKLDDLVRAGDTIIVPERFF